MPVNLDTNENFRKILVEQVSFNWMRFAHIICLNGFYNIVEEIHNENNNQMKLEIFLQRTEINRLNYNEVIANSLYALKRFDILFCVALDGKRLNFLSVEVESTTFYLCDDLLLQNHLTEFQYFKENNPY